MASQPAALLNAATGVSSCVREPSCSSPGSFGGADVRTTGLVLRRRGEAAGLRGALVSKGPLGRRTSRSGRPYRPSSASAVQVLTETAGGGGGGSGGQGGDGGGGGGGGEGSGEGKPEENGGGILGAMLRGWSMRMAADPEFGFKVLTEQVIGVGACVAGDMATRPNWGLNELDFVFSTLVVGSILNFCLMYMLAPTAATASAVTALPGIFAACPAGHMFEPGAYTFLQRAGTFGYKGLQFAVVGFAAGLVGTALSTLLLQVRKRAQPEWVMQNAPPPTVLNAATWGLHLGLSSNIRYQALNGLDAIMVKSLSPGMFRPVVMSLRLVNNVVGGSTFAMLAKATGSQKSSS